jgi:hypothetical protein
MRRPHPLLAASLLAALGVAGAGPARAIEIDWAAFQDESVIEILTVDPDGDPRETKVWVVVVDAAAWVRTNDSRWLANLRRDPALRLRVRDQDYAFFAEEVTDPAATGLVEEAFKAKYGWIQRVMSALRMREPTVLRLTPRARAAGGPRRPVG